MNCKHFKFLSSFCARILMFFEGEKAQFLCSDQLQSLRPPCDQSASSVQASHCSQYPAIQESSEPSLVQVLALVAEVNLVLFLRFHDTHLIDSCPWLSSQTSALPPAGHPEVRDMLSQVSPQQLLCVQLEVSCASKQPNRLKTWRTWATKATPVPGWTSSDSGPYRTLSLLLLLICVFHLSTVCLHQSVCCAHRPSASGLSLCLCPFLDHPVGRPAISSSVSHDQLAQRSGTHLLY